MKSSQSESVLEVCPNCAAANAPETDFCHRCGTPLTSHATTDPVLGVRAEGFAFQKGVAEPRNGLVFIGIWILFGLPLLFFVFVVFAFLYYAVRDGVNPQRFFGTLLGIAVIGGFIALYGAILKKSTKNYLRWWKEKRTRTDD